MTLSSILAAKCRGLSEGSSRGGMRSLRRPLLNCPKTVCIVFCCSARIAAVLRNTTYPAAVKNKSFTAIETAQIKEMSCFYQERFTLFCCVHTYQQSVLLNTSPFLRNVIWYVRTRRISVKPIYMRSCNRFHSHESPHSPTGRVGDIVAMLQIESPGIEIGRAHV